MAEQRERFPVVVHVYLERDGRVALLKRANTGFMDGYYALPGGHQEQGESVSSTAKRELQEELGVVARVITPACVLPYRSGRHQGINFLFSCEEWDGEPVINEPELFAELVWVAPNALPEPTADWIPPALKLVRSGGWYREMSWD
ncbi:MAG: NUDIX domain-containing protein [Gammaproteobacteria bacterium]|nr:MAG: NUDIX domain-containing protein [Gammaproteobacteria bacterium]